MGRSLRVSEEGLKRAKEAFHLTGWTQEYLAGSVRCTRPTVNKFFAGGSVDKPIFEALCRELQLKVVEIADLESEEGQVNISASVNGRTKTDEEKVTYAIVGTASKVDLHKLKAIAALLQELAGDTSIKIVDIEKGSIRLILEGSQESLERIEALFKSGKLLEVVGIPVKDVQFVAPQISEPDEDIKAIDKKRLAFTIAGSVSSEEIQELKAVFTETSDNDEEIETSDKARLVRENISQVNRRQNLIDAILRNSFLRNVILRHINMQYINLIKLNLSFSNLSGADLSRANLSAAHLSGADLNRAYLNRADLSGADLSGADLSAAHLSGANLSGANLSGANLSDAILWLANLSGASLSGTNLSGANLSRAVVEKAQFGRNLGLTQEMKLDLKRRGAIFEDSPGDRSGVLSRR